jgi:hypothetical protein
VIEVEPGARFLMIFVFESENARMQLRTTAHAALVRFYDQRIPGHPFPHPHFTGDGFHGFCIAAAITTHSSAAFIRTKNGNSKSRRM